MKKVGIVTIIDNDNYGNRLQNYAVQEVIKSLKCEPITLLNVNYMNDKRFFLLKIIKRKFFSKKSKKLNIERRELFDIFNENIVFSKKIITPFGNYNNYDFFIVGSDQVWNPNIGRMKDVDLLSFAPENKRISFSASFAISSIPSKKKEKLKKELSRFKAISVREDSGKEIIKELLPEKSVDVLVDPTMLLNSKDWDKVLRRPKQLKTNRYILNYFLGGLSEDKRKEINRIAHENHCDIINILDKNDPFYISGPAEFLYLEKNAFLICTDSFHSSVFAILYDRPFIIFTREGKGNSMNSRLETLLSKFKLDNRRYNNIKITSKNLEHDYSNAYKILKIEKEKSIAFLKKSLDMEGGDIYE